MITPQPQPASYWIDLLEELTGGIPFNTYSSNLLQACTLSDYISWLTGLPDGDIELREAYIEDAIYFQSGQSVIDAALEFTACYYNNDKTTSEYLFARKELFEQVQLYKRCNGIKDR